MSNGIDYGNGLTNRDHANGIRFGVISMHDVTQAWCDDSEPEYCDETEQMCGECQKMHTGKVGETCECECGEEFEFELSDFAEPLAHTYNAEGYEARQSQDDTDIFITKSPFFTYARFCSPCAPGACHLGSPLDVEDALGLRLNESNNKCYCFGHDWFEDGKAPYKVFSVKTGLLVKPE